MALFGNERLPILISSLPNARMHGAKSEMGLIWVMARGTVYVLDYHFQVGGEQKPLVLLLSPPSFLPPVHHEYRRI